MCGGGSSDSASNKIALVWGDYSSPPSKARICYVQLLCSLQGAHTLGRCHRDRSGWDGPWTNAPTTFSNLFFVELTQNKWRKKKWDGPLQYEDKSKQLMMLPTDMALLWDKSFKKYVDMYAKDDEKFASDFAAAFSKLLELGVPFAETAKAVTPPPQA